MSPPSKQRGTRNKNGTPTLWNSCFSMLKTSEKSFFCTPKGGAWHMFPTALPWLHNWTKTTLRWLYCLTIIIGCNFVSNDLLHQTLISHNEPYLTFPFMHIWWFVFVCVFFYQKSEFYIQNVCKEHPVFDKKDL